MASSDNVVRAGFTPKFKDVSTLTSMLTYSYAPIDEQKMQPTDYPYVTLNVPGWRSGSTCLLYDPPIEEFSVIKTDLKAPGAKATFEPISGPSIIICTSGHGSIRVSNQTKQVKPGHVFFVGASAECIMENIGSEGEEFTTFKAFCELSLTEGMVNGNL
jgi:mannose-6-phosphate isomerase